MISSIPGSGGGCRYIFGGIDVTFPRGPARRLWCIAASAAAGIGGMLCVRGAIMPGGGGRCSGGGTRCAILTGGGGALYMRGSTPGGGGR